MFALFFLGIFTVLADPKIIGYLPGFKPTHVVPQDLVTAGYTHIIVAFVTFNETDKGAVVNEFPYLSSTDISNLQKAGLKVLFSLGGASSNTAGATVNFEQVSSKPDFVQKLADSLQKLITRYNFDGIDVDLEVGFSSDGSPSDVDKMAMVLRSLYKMRPGLLISLAPQTENIAPAQTGGKFIGIYASYSNLAMKISNILTWSGVQNYNTGGMNGIDGILYSNADPSGIDFSVAMAVDMLEDWPNVTAKGQPTGYPPYKRVLRDDQVVLGYPAPNSQGNSDGLPNKPNPIIKKIIQCLRSKQNCDTYVPPRTYPKIGGVFCWEVTYDQDNSYHFAKDLKECVMHGNC